ncbi:hypothetical protein K437DRAFT_263935 [Tilletiaria anomala UBC 951]|uniref:Alcohol dehydrogenase-like N-terminal domain-containing protein n=1 Tax=Tilletiaria anomala (strain ATCC 24038 / CBS 436.72 / UBC 951) TaxID=1037660 RepID=A0A066VND7_TILAU|nr:uncharacterized protein K437DRAFT_263935 [Tilletiaria anomala UBC 951]KDN41788.1 hypothetical protein K437DRAFT_263935 [Tilletiaria anomala UBC 951]
MVLGHEPVGVVEQVAPKLTSVKVGDRVGWGLYGVLVHAGVQPFGCIGIVGVSGPGPFAIQFAAKMGCKVAIFSGTMSKNDWEMQLGANNFVFLKETPDFNGDFKMLNASIVLQGLRIIGTLAAERPLQTDMLEFSARHHIKPMIEALPMDAGGINNGIERL